MKIKITKMKKSITIILIIITTINLMSSQNIVDVSETTQKQVDGEWFLFVKGEKFTGIVLMDLENKRHSKNYKDGKLDGVYKVFYSDGSLKFYGNFKNDNKHGLCRWYYENGNLEEKGYFDNGNPNGLLEWYYENGNLEEKGYFDNGNPNGLYEWYYKNGKLKQKSIIKNGENTSTQKFPENKETVLTDLEADESSDSFGVEELVVARKKTELKKIDDESIRFFNGKKFTGTSFDLYGDLPSHLIDPVSLSGMKISIENLKYMIDDITTYKDGKSYGSRISFYNGLLFSITYYKKGVCIEIEYYYQGKIDHKTYYNNDTGLDFRISYDEFGRPNKTSRDSVINKKYEININMEYNEKGKLEKKKIFKIKLGKLDSDGIPNRKIKNLSEVIYEYRNEKLVSKEFYNGKNKLISTVTNPEFQELSIGEEIYDYVNNNFELDSYRLKPYSYKSELYEDGIRKTASYKGSVLHGTTMTRYKNNKIKTLKYYMNGKKIGTVINLNENGTVKSIENYINDKLNGPCITFLKGGIPSNKKYYINGVLVNR